MWSLKHVKLFKSFQNILVDFNSCFQNFSSLYCIYLKKDLSVVYFEIKTPSFMLFYGVLYVPFYSINDCPVNRNWMVVFLSVQLFSEGKLYLSTSLIYFYCIAYETSLVDETYEFIQEPTGIFLKLRLILLN